MERSLRDVYGILIPRRERKVIADLGVESQKDSGRVEGNRELLDIMLDSTAAKRLMNERNESILAAIIPEAERHFHGLSESMRFSHIVHWPEAEPMSPIGRSQSVSRYRRGVNPSRRVLLAGDYLGLPYTDSAAHTGK
jgi:oxygen-dependent protoporphyrinogen oxidase